MQICENTGVLTTYDQRAVGVRIDRRTHVEIFSLRQEQGESHMT